MHKLSLFALTLLLACDGEKPADDTGSVADDSGTDDSATLADNDRDGFTSDVDCDDEESSVYPGADEVCDDLDNDCDGDVDDRDAEVQGEPVYNDADGDGYGDDGTRVVCGTVESPVSRGGDCDDGDADYHPGADESNCDDPNDYNCDGSVGYDDSDGDGYAACEECDDADAATNPDADEVCDELDNDCDGAFDAEDADLIDGVTSYADADGDGFGDDDAVVLACEGDEGISGVPGDCNDADPAYNPEAGETDCTDPNDYNCDGEVAYEDGDGDGVAACEDCDDGDAGVSPDAPEVCDEQDNDCDGAVDDADSSVSGQPVWYGDGDGDGFAGEGADTVAACEQPAGYAETADDCDDTDAAINPDAEETCNELDDDCDGLLDDADPDTAGDTTWYSDGDGDGFGDPLGTTRACEQPAGTVATGTDCDDTDAAINPDGAEVCNGADDDCDFLVDDADADVSGLDTWYKDDDGDGYGDATDTTEACEAPAEYVAASTDCDDGDDDIHPGADELCNEEDDDCDGLIDQADSDLAGGDTYYVDADGDGYGEDGAATFFCEATAGYAAVAGDCDDDDEDINPGADDDCDGVDNDCDDSVDSGGDCPCSQQHYGEDSYLFCEPGWYGYTWSQAESYCESYGYELVTLNDASEDAWVFAYVEYYDDNDDWWIGYTDSATEGTWAWESGSSATYTNWGSGEPNGGSSSDCARYVPDSDEDWHDWYCSDYFNFVCESPE